MIKKRAAKTILLIEDEDDIQNFVSRVLVLEGYQVLQARDGDTGIKIATENPVSLVLLDLRMPVRDGWSVLAVVKSSPALSSIPVVVLSASAGKRSQDKAFSMGAVGYLVKPLSAATLRKTVTRILQPD